jgi:rSAM/selenodomain-associated transferase 1
MCIAALVVLAKAPRAGRSKTRLCPPCTPAQAAALARAALADTLDAVLATPAARRVLVLDGPAGNWVPAGVDVIGQRGDGLDERLAHAFADVGEPALLVGMDTPQVTPADLVDGLARLLAPGTDAVLGPAPDGGYWAIGLRAPDPRAFLGVPMSTARTGRAQLARLRALGLRVALLPARRDVDRIADARAVAALAPGGRFARALATTPAA